jgi:hypothetical protein
VADQLIRKDPAQIALFTETTEEQQLAALAHDVELIKYIKSPSRLALYYAGKRKAVAIESMGEETQQTIKRVMMLLD